MLTSLVDESFDTAVLVVLVASGMVGCVGPQRYDFLRQPAAIKTLAFTTRFLGTLVFVIGLIGMIEHTFVMRWLPLLIAGLFSDLVRTIIKSAANVGDPS